MSVATAPALKEPEKPSDPSGGDPPSLRRRAPARLDITLNSGRSLMFGRGKLHVRAGQPFVLKVLPQSPGHKVEVVAVPPLVTTMPNSRIEGGPVPSYHAEFSGRSPFGVVPLPNTGRLHISILDGLPDPHRMIVPVTVWPSFSTIFLWWVLAVLSIVGLRWQRTAAASNSLADIEEALWGDLPYLLLLFVLSSLLLVVLRLFSWLVSMIDPG